MAHGVIYASATGRPLIEVSASDEALLLAQHPPAGQALLPLEGPPSPELFAQYVVVAGALVAKTETIITATAVYFPADGVTECAVTVVPFVPCTLVVNATPSALTTQDPVLILTSDVPATFAIRLEWLATHWATPIVVTAEAP